MAEIKKKPVKIVETVLRDAHQSLIATRMTTEEMLPIVDKMDQVGYHAVECWGGATFDACLRFLKEDPWERLRKLRDGFKNTKLQMLFRGQNILGYKPYPDDVVEYFVQKSIANGIDVIRIFDCLNDLRNLQTAVDATKKEGGHAQIALSYTIGDAYTLDYWKKTAKNIEEMGADSICIKDMAGLLVPNEATRLVTALKQATDIPIELHTHYTSGVGGMTYLKAVEAGVDIIDTEKIMFPIVVTVVVCLILPTTAPLVGMLMLGNLFRESGVVKQLSETASNALMYIVVIILGTSVGATTSAEAFLNVSTIKIVVLGLVAFAVGTAAGVLFGKLMCKVTGGKVNPLIGSAGVSAVPMAARVSQKVGAEADPSNFLLMHAMGPNVAGVIGTAVAAGTFMAIFGV